MFESGGIVVRFSKQEILCASPRTRLSNVVVLELTERLTVETEADLKEAVHRQLDAGRPHLVLDLARVPYVDSCGLGTMVQAYVSAHRAGGR